MDRLLEKIMKDQATTCSQSNFESEGIWSEFGKKKKSKRKKKEINSSHKQFQRSKAHSKRKKCES